MISITTTDIYDELNFRHTKESADVVGGQEFVPVQWQASVLTTANVKATLSQAGLSASSLVDFVIHKASKVFLTLVFAGNVDCLTGLHSAGFDDDALPIGMEQGPVGAGLESRVPRFTVASMNKTTHKLETVWSIFDTWPTRQIRAFEQNQWQFLAPTFTDDRFFYALHKKCPLPLVSVLKADDNEGDLPTGSGNYSTVYRLGICTEKAQSPIALKVFREDLKKYFLREMDTLRKIRAIKHQHLITPIAAFEKGNKRCFMFPWADGGNLLEFWRVTDSRHGPRPFPAALVSWSLQQMCGLADCLVTLYEHNCRHGDLKPGNILHFKDGGENGRLVIADFGLAKFHLLDTTRRRDKSSIFDRTLRYEPPEMELENDDERETPRSRSYDVWSMGCILLEFCIWLVYGWDYLELFIRGSLNEKFWELKAGVPHVHHRVQEEICSILEHLKADAAVKDIVTLIRDRLLVIRPLRSSDSPSVHRATAHELLEGIRALSQRAFIEEEYLKGPVVSQRTNMGDSLTVREKTIVPMRSQDRSVPPSNESGPRILVRAATGDLDVSQSIKKPDVHPQTYVSRTSSPGTKQKNIVLTTVHFWNPEPNPQTVESLQLGFPALPQAASSQQFELLRQWLRLCDDTHDCCRQKLAERLPEMPTRVLDVGGGTIRLVETCNGVKGRYVALSHCWGNLKESEKFCAKKEDMAHLKQHIDYNRLPLTFRDADNKEDWESESQNMESVFSSAYCTLAASSAKSSIDGFLKTERAPRTCVTHVSANSGTMYLCNAIDNFQKDVEEGVLSTRGWVFQERALSRRTIYFTSNQLYWECGQGIRCETLGTLRNPVAALMGDSNFPDLAFSYFKGGRIVLLHRLYQMYSKLSFTNPTDRSVALLGLEKRLSRTFQTRAEYGIVQEYMERDLLWHRERNGEMLTRIRYPHDRRVPSWSWMAHTGAIEHLSIPFDDTDWCRENIRTSINSGSLREAEAHGGAQLTVAVKRLNASQVDLRTKVIRDNEDESTHEASLRCVVIGIGRTSDEAEDRRIHYVLVVKPSSSGSNSYERIGSAAEAALQKVLQAELDVHFEDARIDAREHSIVEKRAMMTTALFAPLPRRLIATLDDQEGAGAYR
ncbi:uncharacterized protein JN550_000478 [Neoarthrinium moseri]|uniref:uncharacterized protein n=1 Tax=Neoarthrinium moseri TaxID=1658444 RepID=UPI001FDE40EF|nr:uncharacterized protein JN550_000478 [Neoarthrinium moseri]KAI1878296.1 hypothetical protein JN550_000478 [Neoarthrinium moseri]